MSFNSVEVSVDDGNPVELYRFTRGTNVGFFTSADSDLVFQTNLYESVPIQRGDIGLSREVQKNFLEIEVSRTVPYFGQYIMFPQSAITDVTIFRQHPDDGGFATLWGGRAVNFEGFSSTVKIRCEPLFTAVRRLGLRRHFQAQCPHVLYGNQCRANQESFKTNGTVSSASGTAVTAAAFGTQADGWFSGGYIVINELPGEQRQIISHNGTTIEISAPIRDLDTNMTFSAFAGCAHNMDACKDKFNNVPNYGGYLLVPLVNPFDGTTIF